MRIQKLPIWIFAGLFLAFSIFLIESGCKPKEKSSQEASKEKALYQCSMHPSIVSSKPDDCPICGMRLTRIEPSPTNKKILFYRHPMRPEITSMNPAKDEMGMDYIPVYEGEQSGVTDIKVPGHGDVMISPQRQQLIGVQITEVEEQNLLQTIRAVGRVAYDPELYNLLTEYKEIILNQEKVKQSPISGVRERAEALVHSSELKLKLLGISEENIRELLKGDETGTSLLLPEKTAWIYADIYEYESGLVKMGEAVKITSPAFPGKQFQGTVRTIDPILNAATRTLRVRITATNEENILKPEMFVDVGIEIPLGMKLAVPEDAIFNSGENQIVFVDLGGGHFEPRKVRIGYTANDYVEILEGLKKGERVVSSANFLIDSESRLRAAVKRFGQAKE